MIDLWQYLKTVNKPIVLYGIGNGAEKTVNRLNMLGTEVAGIFSSAGFKKNKTFLGHTVTDYETLKATLGDFIILVCFGSHLPQVSDAIIKLSKKHELYAPDVPVSGEVIFDLDFAKKHKNELEKVYNMLADEQSKRVFENTVYFKLTGKIDYLLCCESDRSEAYKLLNLNNNESFLDLGAFTGDTVQEFLSYVDGYDFITALEPDNRNFKRLCQNTADINNINCVNAAATDKVGEFMISANHSRGNSEYGKVVAVNGLTVDYLSRDRLFTLIKVDVEGNELKALEGAKELIKAHKPKMHIACYHTAFDLFEIPLKVLSLNPDYKIYLRHHHCLPAWDINCIFI